MTLIRTESTAQGTFGILTIGDKSWFTLELPQRDNKPNVSCIPSGEYQCSLRYSPNFRKNLFCLQGVPNRSFILIHGANFAGDTTQGYQTHLQGCIAIGKSIGYAVNKFGKRQKCIIASQQALSEFMDFMNGENFTIRIEDGLYN